MKQHWHNVSPILFGAALCWLGGAANAAETQEHSRKVAEQAFLELRDGLRAGKWEAFFDRLDTYVSTRYPANDDFNRWIPREQPRVLLGKEAAMRFFKSFRAAHPSGLHVDEVVRTSANDTTVVFEARVSSQLADGGKYIDRIGISFDICGEKICAYRQYFGGDGQSS